ncbi:alkaline phosphatase family protein [Planctomicrobium piriforme]|uniref:Predicted pyrophosphatase or phosphodiesterase, AlkP superfamily n=1 Tax=Planctomicrobium piriforme TaxID=1576369 RepID=A0A1I3P5U8_9PLAN|nr:ectonucleotide pyrophosphatase/phosphodiesterase [Planctomicrobium piriforme]SFJ16913.1 Predicted pyrophosphatase or phosphodiesterase, AlkP superfamily [Planctomicrobium piriforme]
MTFWKPVVCVLFCLAAPLVSADEPKADRCVILISVDGLANFYLDDLKSQMPTIRGLAKNGARATGGMTASFPTVTWPNHTTLVTGVPPARHGVVGNNYLDRDTGKPVALIVDAFFDKDEIVKVPTVYDAAHNAGLKTSGILWPATRNAKSLDWTVPDMAGEDAWPKYGTPAWLAELREAGLPIEKHGTWGKEPLGGVQRDWLYTRMLSHVLEHHAPNLILIHLVEVDHVEHKFGPRTPEAYWVTSYADDRVRDIVEAVKKSKYADNYTIVLVSDHGFFPIEKEIRPNVLFKKHVAADGKPLVKCVAQGGACMVYILDDARKTELTPLLKEQLLTVDGVEEIFEPSQYDKIGQFTPTADRRAPDLWVAAKSGYAFSDSDAGDDVVAPRAPGGTHGYLPSHDDLQASLILSGAGIESGVDLGHVTNLDVAPTVARLLGINLPTAEGKPLEAALKKTK